MSPPVKLRVSSAQDAVNLLYNHFIKNRHSPAYRRNEEKSYGQCFSMPTNSSYPRCAIAIQTTPETIRSHGSRPPFVGYYVRNPSSVIVALEEVYGKGPPEAPLYYRLPNFFQQAHDSAAVKQTFQLNTTLTEHGLVVEMENSPAAHTSFRACFEHNLKEICRVFKLQYPNQETP